MKNQDSTKLELLMTVNDNFIVQRFFNVRDYNKKAKSSYLTICAERVAIFKAVSEGVRSFTAIAISVPGGGAPCGACRQVMNEFNPKLAIIMGDQTGEIMRETTLDILLPDAFGPEDLTL